MFNLINILIGLLGGIVATLLADNRRIRFLIEKYIRKFFKRKLISIKLTSFTIPRSDDDGMFFVHCIGIRNKMWFTPFIPNVFLLSRGDFDYDAHAYKPLIYFRSRSPEMEIDFNSTQLINEYNSRITPHCPGDPSSSISLLRGFPLRIVILCEDISKDKIDKEEALNHQKILGDLYAAVSNPMPIMSIGSTWCTSIISEDFGIIEILDFSIPGDLDNKNLFADSLVVRESPNRPLCLLDLGHSPLTWPIRFKINNCDIRIKKGKGRSSRKVVINRPKDNKRKSDNILARLRQRREARKIREMFSIKIQ